MMSPTAIPLCLPKMMARGMASMAKKMEAKGRENFLWNSSRYMFIWRVDTVSSSVIFWIYLNKSKEVISLGSEE